MTYDEAVTIWALQKHGNDRVSHFSQDTGWAHTTFSEVVNPNYPIGLEFEYEEGYSYSEYTSADSSFTIYLTYVCKHFDTDTRSSHPIYQNEVVPLAQITREILEVSLSSNSSQEVYY